MKRDPLTSLVELAQARQETTLKRLGELLAESRDDDAKLDLLASYRLDYQARLATTWRDGAAAPVLVNFQRFMAQLESAVAQQGRATAKSHARLERGRQDWHAAIRKLRSFELLLARRAAGQRIVAARRAQAGMDELSARIALAPRRET